MMYSTVRFTRVCICSMIEGEMATAMDDSEPTIGESDVTANLSRDANTSCDPDECDFAITDDDDPFLAGFRDCRRKALRYLRQRNVAVGDELERHLAAVERTWRTASHADGPDARSDEHRRLPASSRSPQRRPYDGDDSALGVSLVDDSENFDVGDSDVDHRPSSMTELSEHANDLLRLAQNNPRINNILNELLTLMDDDDDDDDDDDCGPTDSVTQELKSSYDTMTSSHDPASDLS